MADFNVHFWCVVFHYGKAKVLDHVYEMFHVRYTLHRKAYQHKVNKAIELMVSDAMRSSNFVVHVDTKGREVKMSDAVDDLDAFCKLTDQLVLEKVSEFSENARELVNRIYTRKLYRFVGEKLVKNETEKECWDEIVGGREDIKDKIRVHVADFNYGAKDDNPVDKAYFYTKMEPDTAKHPKELENVQIDCLMMEPKHFHIRIARVFCTEEAKVDEVKRLVDAWKRA